MDPGKRTVLLDWVNCLGLVPVLESLQELQDGILFQKILQLMNEDHSLLEEETPKQRILAAQKFLESHCNRDLKSLINIEEIEQGNELEIGKITVFLLSAVIQSDSGNRFRDPLVNLNPCLQVEIMHMIEAVVFGGFPSNLIFEKMFQLKSVPQKKSSCEDNISSRSKTQTLFTNSPASPISQFLQSPQMTQRMALCEKEREVKNLRCKLETLEKLKNELECDLSDKESILQEKENTLQEKDMAIDQLKRKIASLHQQHLVTEIDNDNENVKRGLEEEIDRLQRKLKSQKEFEESWKKLDAENSELHQENYKLEEQLQHFQKKLDECQDQCKLLLNERSDLELSRNEKEKLITELQEQFKEKEKNLSEMIEMYQGKVTVLEEKLNESDNSLIGERMSDVCIEKQMQELEHELKMMKVSKENTELEKSNVIEKLQLEIKELKAQVSQTNCNSVQSSKNEELEIIRCKYEKAKGIIYDLQKQIETDRKETSRKFAEQIEKYKQYSETKRNNLIECQQLLEHERKISSDLVNQLKAKEKKIKELEELLKVKSEKVASMKSSLEKIEQINQKAISRQASITQSHPALNFITDERNTFKKPYSVKGAVSVPHIPSDNFDDSLELSDASHTNHNSSFDNSHNESSFHDSGMLASLSNVNRLSDADFVTQRPVPAGTGFQFSCQEEESYVFNRSYLADLKQGKCNTPDGLGRLSELQRRNTLCLPHLKTSYPVETQMCHLVGFSDDDLKKGAGFKENLPKTDNPDTKERRPLTPVQASADAKVKVKNGTTYQKPGPPTPGRSTTSKPYVRNTRTPSSLKRLLKSKLGTKRMDGAKKNMAFNIGFSPKPKKPKGQQSDTGLEGKKNQRF